MTFCSGIQSQLTRFLVSSICLFSLLFNMVYISYWGTTPHLHRAYLEDPLFSNEKKFRQTVIQFWLAPSFASIFRPHHCCHHNHDLPLFFGYSLPLSSSSPWDWSEQKATPSSPALLEHCTSRLSAHLLIHSMSAQK